MANSPVMMNRPGFFKFYLSKSSRIQMLIPMPFIMCIGGSLPVKVFLRDRYNNMWQVNVGKVGENWYFQKGWPKFIRNNALKSSDFIVFDYFEENLFDFKILGPNHCETVGAGGFLPNGTEGNDEDVEDQAKDEEEEIYDHGGGDFYSCENKDNLSVKQESRSEGDDDNQTDDSLFVKQELQSEADDDDGGGGGGIGNESDDDVYVKKEPQCEGDDGCDEDHDYYNDDDDDEANNDIENHDNNDDMCVKKESQYNGDDGCDKDHDDYEDDNATNDIENHDNDDDVCVKKESQYKGDDGCDEDHDDYEDDNATNDVENHDNDDDMCVKKEPQCEGHDGIDEDHDDYSDDDNNNDIESHDNDDYLHEKKEPQWEGDDGCDEDHDDYDDDDNIEIHDNDNDVCVKKEPRCEGDDGCDEDHDDYYDDDANNDIENHDNNDDVCVKKEPQHIGDYGCDEDHYDYNYDNDDDDNYIENHDNDDDMCVDKEPDRYEGDDGYDEDHDDANNDIENHDNMTIRLSSQIFEGDGDTKSDDNAFVEKEPHSKANADVAIDDDGDDDKEIEDADYMLSQENEHEEYASKPAKKARRARIFHRNIETLSRNQASLYPKYYGMEIFESGLAPRPKNPYFVTQLAATRKGDLFIPTELIKDYNLDMPKPEMLLVDPHGRVFHGKYKKWKDGRTLYSKGWRRLWKVNNMSVNDICICEFKKEFKKGQNELYLEISIIYANGESSSVW